MLQPFLANSKTENQVILTYLSSFEDQIPVTVSQHAPLYSSERLLEQEGRVWLTLILSC